MFEGVGAVAARSAVRGPLLYDGLAETLDHGFRNVLRNVPKSFRILNIELSITDQRGACG